MADTLKQLKQRVAELEALRAQIDLDIQSYHRVIADQEGRSETQGRSMTAAKAVVNEMFHILDTAGEPLHYREIYKRLKDRGIEVAGQDPLKNTGAHLSADTRFISDGHGNWRLASWRPTPSNIDSVLKSIGDSSPTLVELKSPRAATSQTLSTGAIDDTVTTLCEMFRLSNEQREQLRISLAQSDPYELRRLGRELPPGQALPFLAEVNKFVEVFDGQQSA